MSEGVTLLHVSPESRVMWTKPSSEPVQIVAAAWGDGAIVYMQDLLGVGRDIVLRGGILGFRGARKTDVLERHTGVLPVTLESGVTVHVPAYGIATVRLYDLFLRGG